MRNTRKFRTYQKNQVSDLIKFFNKYLKLSYLDTKDNLPKKIGIVGHKYNICYKAAIELIFMTIRFRKKFRDRISKAIDYDLAEFERQVLDGNIHAESILEKYFNIECYEHENTLANALNSGAIDYCVVPAKIFNQEKKEITELEAYKGLNGSKEMILSAATTIELEHLFLCHECSIENIKNIYTTIINKLLSESIISNILNLKNINFKQRRHTHISHQNCNENKSFSAFICNELYFNKLGDKEHSKNTPLEFDKHLIEFRLLKYKTYKDKDDNAHPPSIHRRFKQLFYFLWRQRTLKVFATIFISILLYVYSLTFSLKIETITILPHFKITIGGVVSFLFSILLYLIFSLLHYRTRTYMQLKKVKGYWLLYSTPTPLPSEVKEKDPHLYVYPRIVRIDFLDTKHLEFEIHMLNNEGLYLKSESFFLDAHDLKKARIIITYSNNDIPESKEIHGFINGISELNCQITYESSNLYEMSGNFFSKSRLEHGKLNYFRLADEDDFELLRASSFIPDIKQKSK